MELLKYHEKNKTKNILYMTPTGHRTYQLLMKAHGCVSLKEEKNSFSLCFSLPIMSAESRDIKKSMLCKPLSGSLDLTLSDYPAGNPQFLQANP